MSEKLPSTNPNQVDSEASLPRRDDQVASLDDFITDTKRRLEEAEAYQRHMEALSHRDENYTPFDDLENQPSAGYEAEVAAAYAENEAFDAQKAQEAADEKAHDRALSQALDQKFAASPKLRFMNRISAEIAQLRKKEVSEATADDDARRLGELEDRLQELLLDYAEQPEYDQAIADILMDEDDTEALERAAENALREQNETKATQTSAATPEAKPSHNESETSEDDDKETDDPLPSRDEVLASFDDRQHDNEMAELWSELGGDEVDAARANLERANLTLNDADKRRARQLLEDAQVAFYAAYLARRNRTSPELPGDDGAPTEMMDAVDLPERPVVKRQQSAKELDQTHPALEGESLEEYEQRHGAQNESDDEAATVEREAARRQLEYQDRDNDDPEQETDNEKDTRRSRLGKFKSWLQGVRNKGGLMAIKAYNGVLEGFDALGKPVTARKEGELDEDYEYRRKRNGGVVAVLGAVAISLAAKYGFDHVGSGSYHGGGSGGETIPTPTETAAHPSPTSAPETVPTPEAPDWSEAARTADRGEGWYQTFKDMHIPQREWDDLLQKVGPQLEKEGYAYRMSDGSFGINHAGALPTEVLDQINNSRS